ncbi:hypothetical protein K1719_007356 [Acacia pycnantha]|nr:hypothetical protein K1719_007356 [Acacia pycnantha]
MPPSLLVQLYHLGKKKKKSTCTIRRSRLSLSLQTALSFSALAQGRSPTHRPSPIAASARLASRHRQFVSLSSSYSLAQSKNIILQVQLSLFL